MAFSGLAIPASAEEIITSKNARNPQLLNLSDVPEI